MIKTKNQTTLITKMFRLKIAQKESEHEFEHSCHVPSHMMSTLSPQIFGDVLAPEVVCHSTTMYCQTLLFILNATLITQAKWHD